MDDQMHSEQAGAAPAAAEGEGQGKPCEACQKPFSARRKWQRFCSTACRNEWHRREAMGPTGRLEDLERRVKALEEKVGA